MPHNPTGMHADSRPVRSREMTAWALTRGEWLPTMFSSVRFDVPVDASAASNARHQVMDALGDVLGEIERSNLELMISELVTNCVRHAGMQEGSGRSGVHA